ncbi:CPBP family intramembrane glutamic endopeptidase [Loktanella sp. DJP18]|uniref:CPBP family intramembrane glutamic endopeptidase n=1 Tax=Loktanella sp. DJP18 TaxID=3409788 RepID=UPI003BB790AD
MHLPDAYRPLLTFRRAAEPLTDLWRIALVWIGFEAGFALTPMLATPFVGPQWSDAGIEVLSYAGFGLDLIVLLVLVRLLHRRGLGSLIGPRPAFWRDLRRSLIAVCLVLLVQQPFDLGPDIPWLTLAPVGGWLVWLIPAALAIAVQVTTEEVYFRGYLTQQLAARDLRRRVWLVGPSVYFGISHLLNGAGLAEGALWAVWAGLLGAACGDLVARTGNLGAAIGLHLGNNLFAALVLGYVGTPGFGLALFLLPADTYVENADGLAGLLSPMTFLDLAYSALGVLVMWLAARVAVRA